MALLKTCPDCGFKSAEIRCPRCNALKVMGCDGSCSTCGRTCDADVALPCDAPQPSDAAVDDERHPGTPIER